MKRSLTYTVLLLCFSVGLLWADSLTSSTRVHVIARQVSSTGATDAPGVVYGRTLTSGYGDDQADRMARYSGTVATSAPVSFDLVAGINDSFGVLATFTSIKTVTVRNESLSNTIGVTGALGSFTVAADGMALMSAPLDGISPGTVTVSLATGSAASFSVLFIGASR